MKKGKRSKFAMFFKIWKCIVRPLFSEPGRQCKASIGRIMAWVLFGFAIWQLAGGGDISSNLLTAFLSLMGYNLAKKPIRRMRVSPEDLDVE